MKLNVIVTLTILTLVLIPTLSIAQPVAVETDVRVETYTNSNGTQMFKIITVEDENEFACTSSNTTFEYDIDWIEDIQCEDSMMSNYTNLLYRISDSAYQSNIQLTEVVNSTFKTCLSESNTCQEKLTDATTKVSACRERITEMYEVDEYEDIYNNYTMMTRLYDDQTKQKSTHILVAAGLGAAAAYFYFKRKYAIDPDSEGLGAEEF